MESATVLNQSDVKKIIAYYLGIDEKKVIKSQYSYMLSGITDEQREKLKKCGIS